MAISRTEFPPFRLLGTAAGLVSTLTQVPGQVNGMAGSVDGRQVELVPLLAAIHPLQWSL